MLIHPPHHHHRHHGGRRHSPPLSSPLLLSQVFVLFIALIIPTSAIAQVSPPKPSTTTLSGNGILNQYDLLLLTTVTHQPSSSSTSSPAQSILLVDLSKTQENKLISLPSLTKFLEEVDERREEDKDGSKTTASNTNAKNNNKGCQRYDHVTGDFSRDLIYFSCDKAIGFFKIQEEEDDGGVVYQAKDSGSITELHYFNDTLYWIEDHKQIKSLSTINADEGPKDIISKENEKIQGLTVNPSTGVLYYTTWPHFSRTNATILEYDLANKEESVLQSGLLLPKSVDSDGEALYWISHPPGIYFTIEMMGLGGSSNEEDEDKVLVMRQAHQHGGSLAVHCGKVYWTDVVDKRVWVVNGGSGKSVLVSDQILGANTGLGFLSVTHGGKEDCNGEEHSSIPTKESKKDMVMIKKMEGGGVEGEKKISNKETLLEKDSYKVQNNGQGGIRLCSRGEAELLSCVGSERFCIVLGYSSVPLCLSRQTQPSPAKTLLASRFSPTNNSLNSSALTMQRHEPHILSESSSSDLPSATSWPPEIVAIVSVISTVAVIMSCISLYMTLRVRSLSKKPIIRRRVVVSRRASESGESGGRQNNSPASVCEMIDIENCCNMNVCETPCYERTLLPTNNNNNNSSSSSNTTSNGTTTTTTTTVISVNSSNSGSGWNSGSSCGGGKEDKRCLLSI